MSNLDAIIVSKALVNAAKKLKIDDNELAGILKTAPDFLSDILEGRRQICRQDSIFGDVLLFIQLFELLDTICAGDDNTATSWMRNPNSALNDVPIDKIATPGGLKETIAYLKQSISIIGRNDNEA